MDIAGQFKQKQPLEGAVKAWNAEHKAASPELRLMLDFEIAKAASRDPEFLVAISRYGSKELRAGCADVMKTLSEMESDKSGSKEYASMAGKMVV